MELLITIIPSILAGGVVTEVVRKMLYRRENDLDRFYDTWKAEMDRVNREMAYMRVVIHALEREVDRLGGNSVTAIPSRDDIMDS